MAAPNEDLETIRNSLIKACKNKDKAEVINVLNTVKLSKEGQVLNLRNKQGTTPLHEACLSGATDIIPLLLKHGTEANVYDARGYTPIHCAAYGNHKDAIQALLEYRVSGANLSPTVVDQHSDHAETPLHVACLQGNLEAVEFLYQAKAELKSEDLDGNNLLHFISSSNSRSLWEWFLGVMEHEEILHTLLHTKNKMDQTPAHVASLMGNTISVGAFAQLKVDFDLPDGEGKSANNLLQVYGYTECLQLATGRKELVPPLVKAAHNLALPAMVRVQRSLSTEGSPPRKVRRKHSLTGTGRPKNLTVVPPAEGQLMHRGSIGSMLSNSSSISNDSLASNAVTVSKENINRITGEIQSTTARRGSLSSESFLSTLIEQQTAYDPPFSGFHSFTKKETLTPDNYTMNWEEHDIKFVTKIFHRKSKQGQKTAPSNTPIRIRKLDVCLSVSMTTIIPLPNDYSIVSPICFVSCRYWKPKSSPFALTLPHALNEARKYSSDVFKILSWVTCDLTTLGVESPSTDVPANANFIEIKPDSVKVLQHGLKFKSSIMNPSLFAIAMRNEPSAVPKPFPVLQCALFCIYERFDEYSKISQIRIKFYIGMLLKTVQMIIKEMCTGTKSKMEECHFVLSDEICRIETSVGRKDDWTLESGGMSEIRFNQVALTEDTDQQPYTHELSYPPHKTANIVPAHMDGPASCDLTLLDRKNQMLGQLHFVPFSPFKYTPTPTHAGASIGTTNIPESTIKQTAAAFPNPLQKETASRKHEDDLQPSDTSEILQTSLPTATQRTPLSGMKTNTELCSLLKPQNEAAPKPNLTADNVNQDQSVQQTVSTATTPLRSISW